MHIYIYQICQQFVAKANELLILLHYIAYVNHETIVRDIVPCLNTLISQFTEKGKRER